MTDAAFINAAIARNDFKLAFGYARDLVRSGTNTSETDRLMHVAHAHVLIAKGEAAPRANAPSYYAQAAQCAFIAGDTWLYDRAVSLEKAHR
jgi:hypothetical protein